MAFILYSVSARCVCVFFSVTSISFMGGLLGGQDSATSALTRSKGLLLIVSPPMPNAGRSDSKLYCASTRAGPVVQWRLPFLSHWLRGGSKLTFRALLVYGKLSLLDLYRLSQS